MLHYASLHGNVPAVKWLLHGRGEQTGEQAGLLATATDVYGRTPSHLAAMRGFDDVVRILEAAAAGVAAVKDTAGESADDMQLEKMLAAAKTPLVLLDDAKTAGAKDGDNGGWDKFIAQDLLPTSDGIPIVDVSAGFTPDDFYKQYVLKGKPCILRGGATAFIDPAQFRR
jgi:hypothetical protein